LKVNIFTKDLEALFRSKPNDGAI